MKHELDPGLVSASVGINKMSVVWELVVETFAVLHKQAEASYVWIEIKGRIKVNRHSFGISQLSRFSCADCMVWVGHLIGWVSIITALQEELVKNTLENILFVE